jgi:hypothetical protein
LMSSGGGRIYITHILSATSRQARLYLKASDSEVTPQGDALIAAYMQVLSPDYPFPAHLSLYGKQNMEIDLTYNGPSNLLQTPGQSLVEIKLGKFDISNQMYNSSANFYLKNDIQGDARAFKLSLKAESTVNEQYDALLQEMIRSMIRGLYTNKDPKLAAAQPFLQQYTPNQMYAIVYPAIPNLHSFGKMVEAVDFSFQGSPDFKVGDATLDTFELSAAPYGITGKGSAKLTVGHPLPVGSLTLVCTNCPRLVDDMAAYNARLQKTVIYFNPAQAASMTLDPKLVEGIKGFLGIIAQTAGGDKNTFTYVITSDETAGIAVNGKRPDELMHLYSEYIGAVTKPAAAAAPAPTSATAATPTPPVQAPATAPIPESAPTN